MKTFLVILLIIAIILFIIYGQYIELKYREGKKALLNDLKTFSYFVGNCKITSENKELILTRIKEYRSKNVLYESKEYSDLIFDIFTLYVKRFYKTETTL